VLTGFQLAMKSGPLCDEPMWGVGIRVEVEITGVPPRDDQFGPLSGQVSLKP
jgi:translation elongation factor EF-G